MDLKNKDIIFFDGLCNLCSLSVNFIIAYDKKSNYLFAPLQGKTAKKILPEKYMENLDSVVLFQSKKISQKSEAAFDILQTLFGFKFIFRILRFIPKPISDSLYNLISKNRYFLFGKSEVCRVPSSQEKEKFLE